MGVVEGWQSVSESMGTFAFWWVVGCAVTMALVEFNERVLGIADRDAVVYMAPVLWWLLLPVVLVDLVAELMELFVYGLTFWFTGRSNL